MIDYYEASGYNVAHYASVLAAKDYTYGREFMPHDSMAREMGTGLSIFETLKAQTNRHPYLVPKLSVMDGINAGRVTLGSAWINAAKCYDGLEALRAYKADYDEKAKVFSDLPKHDWSSHGCLTGDAMVLTDCGLRRIDAMQVGDRVWTPAGYACVTWAGEVKCTDQLITIELADGRCLSARLSIKS